MNKFLKTGLLATAAVALSLVGFGHAFGYGGGGGGGGAGGLGSPRADLSLNLVINSGAEKTNTTNVVLTINGGIEATGMAISNTPDFANTTVIPYATSLPWTLESGVGEKTVYVKFFRANSNNASPVLSDSITLDAAPQQVLGEKITDLDTLIAELRFGMRGPKVVELQDALKRTGFMTPAFPSTGYFGPVTQLAVKKYLASLTTPPTTPTGDIVIGDLHFGMRGPAVVALQDALKAAGFFPVGIRSTGYFGPITRAAVEKYLASR